MNKSITLCLAQCLALTAGLLLAPLTQAAIADSLADDSEVNGFYLLGHHADWTPVSRDELIVWATPAKPYLVSIMMPADDLRFEDAIVFKSQTHNITRFDWVIVRGQYYRIESIHKLDKAFAKQLSARK